MTGKQEEIQALVYARIINLLQSKKKISLKSMWELKNLMLFAFNINAFQLMLLQNRLQSQSCAVSHKGLTSRPPSEENSVVKHVE